MSDRSLDPVTPDAVTPGRRAQVPSTLARHDLVARLGRLPVPPEVVGRLARVIEDEVARALATRAGDAFTADEIEAAGGGAELIEQLRTRREEQRKIDALRAAGLHELSGEELDLVLEQARRGR